uniref:Uncharacterized protein n=1 Tax=Anguilla anguilla TaxID=7936 RepID=A0A0E9V688_ANGAN
MLIIYCCHCTFNTICTWCIQYVEILYIIYIGNLTIFSGIFLIYFIF